MPKKNQNEKKPLYDRPTAEAIAELFPPEVIALAQQVAHEKDTPRKPPSIS